MGASGFSRSIALLQSQWGRLCPASPAPLEMGLSRSPFGEEAYLKLEGIPAAALGAPAPPPLGCTANPTPLCGDTFMGGTTTLGFTDDSLADHRQRDEEWNKGPEPADSLTQVAGPSRCNLYDVHVLLHPSYRVPTLFLRGYMSGEFTVQLNIILQMVSVSSSSPIIAFFALLINSRNISPPCSLFLCRRPASHMGLHAARLPPLE